jgi:hypothetical protein
VANGKWPIESHYPTQAKERLEWGTQHLLPVWQKLHPHPTLTKVGVTEAYIGMDPEMRSPEGAVPDTYRAVMLTRQGGPEVLEGL